MPNWCENELWVKGEREKLKIFIEKAKGKDTDFSLNSFIPIPEELMEFSSPPLRKKEESEEEFQDRINRFKEKYGAEDWYDWAIRNWGIKWDVKAEIVSENENEVCYVFDSPWGPPIEGLIKISRLYPDLSFKLFYFEEGMCFGGVASIKNGEVFDDYHEDKEAIEWLKSYNYELWSELYGETYSI